MRKLQKKYGLQDPQQIKMKILWMALKELLKATFGESERNKKLLRYYDDQWKRIEKHER